MLAESYPYYLAGKAEAPNHDLIVTNKYTGEPATRVALADPAAIDAAIAAAARATIPMRKMLAYERQAVLSHCVARFTERAEELAGALCVEAGKPIRDSRGEVGRLIDTFRIAAEESVRMTGEVLPMDISARARGYSGMWKRVPVGPCSFIAPFNFPLNLVAHKVAPALAVGCPFVLKPASLTPIGALIIGEILAETDLPAGAFSVLPCRRDGANLFTEDERLKLLSFTGSPGVGWALKAKAGKKKVVLELGGNAAVIVDEDVDLTDAVPRILSGAFYQSGQSCISVQRIIAHESIYDALRGRCEGARGRGSPGREDLRGPHHLVQGGGPDPGLGGVRRQGGRQAPVRRRSRGQHHRGHAARGRGRGPVRGRRGGLRARGGALELLGLRRRPEPCERLHLRAPGGDLHPGHLQGAPRLG